MFYRISHSATARVALTGVKSTTFIYYQTGIIIYQKNSSNKCDKELLEYAVNMAKMTLTSLIDLRENVKLQNCISNQIHKRNATT